jgi:hypothetical protein
MDQLSYVFGWMLGLALGMILFYSLGAKRRVIIPPSVYWTCIFAGVLAVIYGLSHATAPSFARRVTVTGPTDNCTQIKTGKSFKTSFSILPSGANPLRLETNIILPSWADPQSFNGRIFKVTYLDDPDRSVGDEAIDITILSGKHAGFHDAKDARLMGSWLGIPSGAALGAFGLFGVRLRKSDLQAVADDAED